MATSSRPLACVRNQHGGQHNTMGASLFACCADALHWFEVDCLDFGTARRLYDYEVLTVTILARPDAYQARVGRVRRWIVETGYLEPWWTTWR